MSLLNSLFSGVSGLRNHQAMMDNIGNNISNVNTIGFKSSRMTFSDTFNQFVRFGSDPSSSGGGSNAFQIGLGMKINSIDRNWNQGTFERTGIKTDLALQGDSLFVLNNNGERFYSRAGTFSFDADGNLVNNQNGGIVQGKVATSEGEVPPGNNLQDIKINTNERLPAVATTEVNWGGNLDSTSSVTASDSYEQAGNINSGGVVVGDTVEEYNTVYNEFGDAYRFKATYTNTGVDQWDMTWELSKKIDDTTYSNPPELTSAAPTAVTFDANGDMTAPAASIAIQDANEGINFTFDPTKVTQKDAAETITSTVDSNREPTIVNGTVTVFDSLGESHSLTIRFTKLSSNNWNFRATVPSDSGSLTNNTGTVSFKQDGSIDSISPNPPVLTFTPSGGASLQNIELNLGEGFEGITQTSSNSVVSSLSQNGSDAAILTDYSIDQYGYIIGVFSNGQSRNLAQILLADFPNNNGLISTGENMFQISANAGEPIIGDPGEATGTTIQSGALEQSNVDLSEEFTKMIVAQRGFQSNARVVTTSDQLLQEITNLVR